MRRRRADHCLLQASAALDADYPEAAEDALNEARALCPTHPQLQEVAARLRAAVAPSGPASERRSPVWIAIVVAWLLGAIVLIG